MSEEDDILRRRSRVGYLLETRDWEVRPICKIFGPILTTLSFILVWFLTVYLIRSGLRTVPF